MRQAQRQSRKPERRRMETAALRLLVLAGALALSGCASMGLSDTLLSGTSSAFQKPSIIRSQNSPASDDESSSTAAADYSSLKASAGSANSNAGDGNLVGGLVPAYASGHAFVPRRARLGKPILLSDKVVSPPANRNKQSLDGQATSQLTIQPSNLPNKLNKVNDTTVSSQSPSSQQTSADTIEIVTARRSPVNFDKAEWQEIPDSHAANKFRKSTAAENQDKAFATNGGWSKDPRQATPQQASVAKQKTNNPLGDESERTSSLELPATSTDPQTQLAENATDDATVGNTEADLDTATAKEPTVLDRLRGLYVPRREESISERNRKSTRRWTDPFGLLRDREPETVDAIVGATTPLPASAESPISVPESTNPDPLEIAQGREALLEPLIAQVELELAEWPTLPHNKPQHEVEWRRRQTDLRMLYMIAGRSAESIRVIESLPEKEQEFWQSMMLALESYRGSHDSTARTEQLTETLEYVRTASRQLQPLSTMKIRRLNFCNRIDGFGSFSVFPTSEFNAGQPLLLYAEIENYRSELTSDSQYQSEFAAMIEFFRAGETEPIASRTIRLPEIEDLCSVERTDYFQSYELTVPSLSPGKYTLRLQVRDQLSLQTATTELPFDIRPLGSQQ